MSRMQEWSCDWVALNRIKRTKKFFQWLHKHPTVTRIADISRLDYSINRTVCSWKLNNDVDQDNLRELWVLIEVKSLQSNNVRQCEKKLLCVSNIRTTVTTTTVFFFLSSHPSEAITYR
jgi:hypothetical protein